MTDFVRAFFRLRFDPSDYAAVGRNNNIVPYMIKEFSVVLTVCSSSTTPTAIVYTANLLTNMSLEPDRPYKYYRPVYK